MRREASRRAPRDLLFPPPYHFTNQLPSYNKLSREEFQGGLDKYRKRTAGEGKVVDASTRVDASTEVDPRGLPIQRWLNGEGKGAAELYGGAKKRKNKKKKSSKKSNWKKNRRRKTRRKRRTMK